MGTRCSQGSDGVLHPRLAVDAVAQAEAAAQSSDQFQYARVPLCIEEARSYIETACAKALSWSHRVCGSLSNPSRRMMRTCRSSDGWSRDSYVATSTANSSE